MFFVIYIYTHVSCEFGGIYKINIHKDFVVFKCACAHTFKYK